LIEPVEWLGDRLRIIDQTKLPEKTVFIETVDYRDVVTAIKELKVRGAPAIGVATAYGIALGAMRLNAASRDDFLMRLDEILQAFSASRPTAVNLFRAVDRMKRAATANKEIPAMKQLLIDEAIRIHAEEQKSTERLSKLGADLIRDGDTVLTHCNAGPLAATGYGTALGIIIAAKEQGKKISVIADETRPLLQGARLTTWELVQEKIPVTLITDSMAGFFLNRNKVNCVIVGADRIAANGDTANKIGTYSLAVLAAENKVPFYVAAPTSTIDISLGSGSEIPIEERSPIEITTIAGVCMAPGGAKVANPAFDVTPNKYIAAIVTEKGIVKAPYLEHLNKLLQEET